MNKKFIKVFLSMAFFVVFGKGLGFCKNMFVAARYGTGFVADVYAFEDGFVNEVYAVFSSFLGCTFIPMYLSLKEKERNRLVNQLLLVGLGIMSVLFVLIFVFTAPILKILVPGYFELYDISRIISITKFNMVNLIGVFLINYLVTILHANEFYIYLTFEAIVSNVILIIYLAFFSDFGIWGLITSRITANLLLAGILIYINYKKGFIGQRTGGFLSGSNILEMVKTALPMLLLAITAQLNYIVDRSMASEFTGGSIAMLNYANVLSMAIYAVVGYVVSSYSYPLLGRVQDNTEQLNAAFAEYFMILCRLVFPIVLTAGYFAYDIVFIVYGHGKMTAEGVVTIAKIFLCYLPGVTAYCIKNYYVKLYYIKKSTKPLVLFDAVGCSFNIILNITLGRYIGVCGLAIATSLSYIVMMVLQMAYSRKQGYSRISLRKNMDIILAFVLSFIICALTHKVFTGTISSAVIGAAVSLFFSLGLFNIGLLCKGIRRMRDVS